MSSRDPLSIYEDESFGIDESGFHEGSFEKEAKEEPMIPKSRFDEVNEQLKAERETYLKMVQGGLNQPQQQQYQQPIPQSPPQDMGPPEGIDDEAWKVLGPVLRKEREIARREASQEAYNAIRNQYGDALTYAQKQAGISDINERVPGFEQELYKETKELFESLPPAEQQRYNNPVGIEALATRVKLNRYGGGDLSMMAHSAPKGNAPPNSDDDPRNINMMSEEEFVRRYGD